MTKTKLLKMLPVRDFPLAVSVAVVAMVFLGASGYPPEEWAAVVVAFYVAFRLGLAAVMGVMGYAAKLLAGYGRRVLRRHGVELPPVAPEDPGIRKGKGWLIAVIVVTVLSISAGLGIAAGGWATAWLEITPLSPAFSWAAWGLLGCGVAGLLLLLGIPAVLFLAADARIRIRVVSNARLASAFSILPEIQAGIPSARGK